MAAEVDDLNIIEDEETLRRMWQQTEDFSQKKEIRMRMYKLREERLKSYYIPKENSSNGVFNDCELTKKSHTDSLSNFGFLAMKTKEIRDSVSPTLDLKKSASPQSIYTTINDEHVPQTSKMSVSTYNSNKVTTIQSQDTSVVDHNSKDIDGHIATQYYLTSSPPNCIPPNCCVQNLQQSSNTQHVTHNSKTNQKDDIPCAPIPFSITYPTNEEQNTQITETVSHSSTTKTSGSHHSIKESRSVTESGIGTKSNMNNMTTVDESTHNENSDVINKLHKFDSYLFTEAGADSPGPLTPASYTNESCSKDVVNTTSSHESHLTKSQTKDEISNSPCISKISTDVSATHNAFASSLRASPDHDSSSNKSSSKMSLDRISPFKSPRVSPEKFNNSSHLSHKTTVSSQNKITTPTLTKGTTENYDLDKWSTTHKKSSSTNTVHTDKESYQKCTKSCESSIEQQTPYSCPEHTTSKLVKLKGEGNNFKKNQCAMDNIYQLNTAHLVNDKIERMKKPLNRNNYFSKINSNQISRKIKTGTGDISRSTKATAVNSHQGKSINNERMHKNKDQTNENISIYRSCVKKSTFSSSQKNKTSPECRVREETHNVNNLGRRTSAEVSPKSKTDSTTMQKIVKDSAPYMNQAKTKDFIRNSHRKLSGTHLLTKESYQPVLKKHLPKHKEYIPSNTSSERHFYQSFPKESQAKMLKLQNPSVFISNNITQKVTKKYDVNKLTHPRKQVLRISTKMPQSPNGKTKDDKLSGPGNPETSLKPMVPQFIDVREGNDFEEADIIKQTLSQPMNLHYNQSSNKITSSKRRSVSCKEFSTRKPKQTLNVQEESSEKIISTDNSSSEDEPIEEILIEEVDDNDESKLTNLRRQISTDAELEKLNVKPIVDIDLIEEEKFVTNSTNQQEELIKNEKLIKEGEFDGSIPPVEVVLGENKLKTINEDFLKHERQFVDTVMQIELNNKKVNESTSMKQEGTPKTIQIQKKPKTLSKGKNSTKSNNAKELIKTPLKNFVNEENRRNTTENITKNMINIEIQSPCSRTIKSSSKKEINPRLKTPGPYLKENGKFCRKVNLYSKTKSEIINKQIKTAPQQKRRSTDKIKTAVQKVEIQKSNKKNTYQIKMAEEAKAKKLNREKKGINNNYNSAEEKTSLSESLKKPAINVDKKISSKGHSKSSANKKKIQSCIISTDKVQTGTNYTGNVQNQTDDGTQTPKTSLSSTHKIHTTTKNYKIQPKEIPTITNTAPESISSSSNSSLIGLNKTDSLINETINYKKLNGNHSPTPVPKEPHLSVIIRLPSSSRETTPNKQCEEPLCTVTDEEGSPRYADCVTEPDDMEILNKCKLNKLRFEKITDLDEEVTGEGVSVSVTDRRNKFIESTREMAKKQTIAEDETLRNREQAVFKTKEIFETVAKKQQPICRPLSVLNRSFAFVQKSPSETILEGNEGNNDEQKSVSKKQSEQDYKYIKGNIEAHTQAPGEQTLSSLKSSTNSSIVCELPKSLLKETLQLQEKLKSVSQEPSLKMGKPEPPFVSLKFNPIPKDTSKQTSIYESVESYEPQTHKGKASYKLKPIEVHTVENKHTKQVFDHTAITKIDSYISISKDSPALSDWNVSNVNVNNAIEGCTKSRSTKSTSPSKTMTEMRSNSPTPQKMIKLKAPLQSCGVTNENKLENHLTTGGNEYNNCKTYMETENQQESLEGGEGATTLSPERNKLHTQNSPVKIKTSPFGVTLKKSIYNTNKTVLRHQLSAEEKKIEGIFDLETLERMLERTVTKYDIRSRIRAQIRLIKRQQEASKTSSRSPSPEKILKKKSSGIQTNRVSTSGSNVIIIDETPDEGDKVRRKRLHTNENAEKSEETKSRQNTVAIGDKSFRALRSVKLTGIEKYSEKTNGTTATTSESHFSCNNTKCTTESIISGYGVGPTDHDGRPLFGLKALRTSNDTKFAVEKDNLRMADAKQKIDFSTDVSNGSGNQLFGLKALRSSNYVDDQLDWNYSSNFNSKLFSKDGKEPIRKMAATPCSFEKPVDGEFKIVTTAKTTTTLSNSANVDNRRRISKEEDVYRDRKSLKDKRTQPQNNKPSISDDSWKSKFSSSSLIRKISNEHFEKAQRKFSTEEASTPITKRHGPAGYHLESRGENYSSSLANVSTSVMSNEKLNSTHYTSVQKDGLQETSTNQVDSLHNSDFVGKTTLKSINNGSFAKVVGKFQQPKVSSESELPDNDDDDGGDKEEEQESVCQLNRFIGDSGNLREMQKVPEASSKSTLLVQRRRSEKKQNKEIDIKQIWNEDQLRNLLEVCSDYENRRLIRARLQSIMAENKASTDLESRTNDVPAPRQTQTDGECVYAKSQRSQSSPSSVIEDSGTESEILETITTVTNTNKKNDVSSCTKVQNRAATVTSRAIKANSVTSPFSKFRQLDRQNSLPSSGAPTHITFTGPHLAKSATTIRDRMLNWVKAQTKEYENVQIDNFSTSWNNGLAFCALIHHFCPHAFDYNKLTPEQRRYNFELAFRVAEDEAGIVPLLDVEDMVMMKRPDWKCVFTYVQSVYQRFHATSEALRP